MKVASGSRTTRANLALCAASLLSVVASAQTPVHVVVDLAKPINVLGGAAIGFSTSTSSGSDFDLAGAPYLRLAGISTPRYPGNAGAADLYHWSTRTVSKYKGIDAPYLAPGSDFPTFALMAEKLGNAVIMVNYGSNPESTGGGEPGEAAAWVAYANGKPEDTRPIAKDPGGDDWHTVGFWASLRAGTPIATDDGFNFLRIHHPAPFDFKLWQVGGQVYNNGFFGGDHTGVPDLHGPTPNALKDFGRLRGVPKLAPAVYAENLKAFAAAMKEVDPSILIGSALPTKTDPSKSLPDFNRAVLKAACPNLDFVSLDWQTGGTVAPEYNTLDESSLFDTTISEVGTLIRTSLDDDKLYCAKGHTPRIALSQAAPIPWPKVDHPVVTALWVANTYTLLIESGFINTDWSEAYGNTMLSPDRTKFGPAFYGLQMMHIVARNPGDALVQVTPAVIDKVSVHASLRKDGNVGFMIVNTDPKLPATVKITVKNGGVGTAGKRFDYGANEFSAGKGLTSLPLTISGNEFTVTVPAYTVTDLLLTYVKP